MPRPPARPPGPAPLPPASSTPPTASLSTLVAGGATFLFVVLVGLFFTTRLPNNPAVTRLEIFYNIPEFLLLCLPGGDATPRPGQPALDAGSGWRYFPQRFDLLAAACLIWIAAWGLGRLVLRGIGLFPRLDTFERNLWGCAAGIGLLSVATLLLGLAGVLNPWLFRGALLAVIVAEVVLSIRGRSRTEAKGESIFERRFLTGSLLPPVVTLAVLPFLAAMLLGAMLPPTDFDVREYHLEGPKEYFLAGRIHFLPHNVYTSFPFCTEMLPLLGMVLRGDWYRGALVGQAVLMGFAPLTAAGLFFASRRWFSERVAWLALLVWLTAPWTYRISTIAYAEGGLAAFLLLALVATIRAGEAWRTDSRTAGGWFLLAGFLAGNGPACKYPGALSVAIPMFLFVAWTTLVSPRLAREPQSPAPSVRQAMGAILLFLVGGAVAFGPWLLKNLFETGNPFYPLMYSIFGGRDWDAVMHAKWQAGHPLPLGTFHGVTGFLRDQGLRFLDAFLWNDWQTPLALAALPLALFLFAVTRLRRATPDDAERSSMSRMVLGLLLLETLWLFESWCLLSHRLDRFWVPMLPILCWLAAIVLDAVMGRQTGRGAVPWLARTATVAALLGGVTLYHLAFIASGLCGNNVWLMDEKRAQKPFRNATVALLEDSSLPGAGGKVLFVGEAEVFEARFPYVYNTVFDRAIFEEWFSAGRVEAPPAAGGEGKTSAPAKYALKPVDEIRRTLAGHGITHLAVNWSEILRYRPTYTYTDFVHPDRFHELVALGLLRPLPSVQTFREFELLPPEQKQEVERWAPGMVQILGGKPIVPGVQVFEVIQ